MERALCREEVREVREGGMGMGVGWGEERG